MNKWPVLMRQRRDKLELTQTELAVSAGVSLPSIQNMEAGRANPSMKTLEAVFAVLGVQIKFEVESELTSQSTTPENPKEKNAPKNTVKDLKPKSEIPAERTQKKSPLKESALKNPYVKPRSDSKGGLSLSDLASRHAERKPLPKKEGATAKGRSEKSPKDLAEEALSAWATHEDKEIKKSPVLVNTESASTPKNTVDNAKLKEVNAKRNRVKSKAAKSSSKTVESEKKSTSPVKSLIEAAERDSENFELFKTFKSVAADLSDLSKGSTSEKASKLFKIFNKITDSSSDKKN